MDTQKPISGLPRPPWVHRLHRTASQKFIHKTEEQRRGKKRSRGDGQERRNPLKFKQIGKVILLIFETSREIPRVLLIWNNVVTI